MTPSGRSLLWLRVLLAVGAMLAVVLLMQTVVNYRYVADSLIRQSARLAADDRVRDVERAARLTRPQDAAGFQIVLDEVRGDAADQIAEIALLQGDGSRLAASPPATVAVRQGLRRPGERTETLVQETRDGRSVFVGVFPCRCSLPRRVDGPGGSAAHVTANPADLLLLVSDGIPEAPDAEGRPYGDDRLLEVLERSRTLPASAIRDAILASVAAFTQNAPPPDDRTLLVVRLPDVQHPANVS